MNMFRLVAETFGPAERKALRRGAVWGAAAFTLVAALLACAGLGFVAAFLDGAILAWLIGSAGLLTGLQDGRTP